jgi:hypothetical protein
MAEAGGWNRGGGVAVMPASTYPNHATFVTGVPPAVHGLWSSKIPGPAPIDGPERVGTHPPLVDAWEVGPAVPTLFEVCGRGGRSSAAVLGDHHLVGAMGAGSADSCWPAKGEFGDEVAPRRSRATPTTAPPPSRSPRPSDRAPTWWWPS